MIFSPFKTAQYRRYNYQPRTFDPDKKARQQRQEAIRRAKDKQELDLNEYDARERLSSGFERHRERPERQDLSSTLGLLVLILVLGVSIYAYFVFDGFENYAVAGILTSVVGYIYFRIKQFRK